MDKKPLLYLDTSVISYLDQQDAPERLAETHAFWRLIQAGKYDAVISQVTRAEIFRCNFDKRLVLSGYMEGLRTPVIETTEEVRQVAEDFIRLGILKPNSYTDCLHLASALVGGCDFVVSWNFRHMVNPKTVHGARYVAAMGRYKEILIYSPTSFINQED